MNVSRSLLIALTFAAAAPVFAQSLPPSLSIITRGTVTDTPKAPVASIETVAALRDKYAAAQAELDRIEALDAMNATPPGTTPQEVIERHSLAELLVRTYQLAVEELKMLDDVRQNRADLAAREREWAGPPGKPPYSALLADQLRGGLQSARLKVQAFWSKLKLLEDWDAAARDRLKTVEGQARLARERFEATSGGDDGTRLAWLRELADLRVRAAAARVNTISITTTLTREQLALSRAEEAFAARRVAVVSGQVRFSQDDLDVALARLQQERDAAERDVQQAQASATIRQKELDATEAALVSARSTGARPGEAAAAFAARVAKLERDVDLLTVQARTATLRQETIGIVIDILAALRSVWQYRWLAANSDDGAKLQEAYAATNRFLARIAPWQAYLKSEQQVTASELQAVATRLRTAGGDEERAFLQNLNASHLERQQLQLRAQAAVDRLAGTLSSWKEQFEERRSALPAWARVREAGAYLAVLGGQLWDFELFAAEDTIEVDGRRITGTRSVTVGKSIGAIVLLVAGWLISSWLVRRAQRVLVQRTGLDPNLANVLRRWVQFIVLMVLFVIALDIVKIPLTIFAFLGGALAIGFGFGAQNLLKNFMGGIIMLIERPLRVGDLVQVGDIVGRVTNIGIRSSTVFTADGIDTLIPNSSFVENNVTNWTYSTARVRRTLKVGVAYGSPTRQVSDVLLAQAGRHGHVLKDPAPRVLFEDFGDSALVFSLQFWIDYAAGADGAQIASDLRFMIERALSEAGIALPFPQRDLHLAGPVKVEVVSPPAEASP